MSDSTKYINVGELNPLQTAIMQFVDFWVRDQKVPVPKKEIYKKLIAAGEKDFTIDNALTVLLRKGYIRRAITISNKTTYVQLRRI